MEITVDLLWSVEQVEHLQKKLIHTQDFEIYLSLLHLPKCKLKVHLSEVENPTQVLRQSKIKWAFDQGDQSINHVVDLTKIYLVAFCSGRHAAGSVGTGGGGEGGGDTRVA